MKKTVFSFILLIVNGFMFGQNGDSLQIRCIYNEALSKGESYENLRVLCKKVGARLSGSPEAEKAVLWGQEVMKKAGFDSVWLQPVMVPHWIRGENEFGIILPSGKGKGEKVPITALGGSVPTPEKGILAEVIEVQNFEELATLGEAQIKGKIVLFNRPMNEQNISTFTAYGGCVNQRSQGASQAAKYGALAVLVRSMTLLHDEHPHTGVMSYDENGVKIPAAAIATKYADQLSKQLKSSPSLKFHLRLSCQSLPDVPSFNVIGEIWGSEFPQEYIIVGGHLDSWDKGEGAHDDGAGCVQSMEALRVLKACSIRPKHTLRAVLFINEENGAKGAEMYANEALRKVETHLYAIESDRGGFTPRGFSIDGTPEFVEKVQGWKPLLAPYNLTEIVAGGSGVDVGFLKKQAVALMGYVPDSQRYFDYHHANTDVFEAVNQRELELGGAAMAALIYLLDKE